MQNNPISYPSMTINGEHFEFRFTHSAQLLMNRWGYYDLSQSIPSLVWAAAMAGSVDGSGKFRSAGFDKPTEFTDKISPEDDLKPIYDAVSEALKKAAPKAKIELVKPPAKDGTEQPAA